MSKRERPHGNSRKNKRLKLLYAIYDHKYREIYKFGTTADDGKDQLPKRTKDQITQFNSVSRFIQFTGRVLKRAIVGTERADKAEDDAVEAFRKKRGRLPEGNKDHPFRSRNRE